MVRWLGATIVIAAIAIAWSCTVDRKSDGLQCGAGGTCSSGRVCHDGYCVVGTPDASRPIDAPLTCPSVCSACNFATQTCTIEGVGSGAIACPAGWACVVECTSSGACGDITCTAARSCDVHCTAGSACGNVTCGTGRCSTTCTGMSACGGISCRNSCRCDVSCDPALGECGTMACPVAPGGKFCTSNGLDGSPCLSTFVNPCHSC